VTPHERWCHRGDHVDTAGQWAATAVFVLIAAVVGSVVLLHLLELAGSVL